MSATTTHTTDINVEKTIQETVEIVDQVSAYGNLIADSFYIILGGMIAVFIIHKLVSSFLYPHLDPSGILKRLFSVVFATLYVLILAIAVLVVLKGMNFDINVIAKITLLSILTIAVIVFFLVPFLPKLPFVFGNLVEINGIIGIVNSISSFHTTIKKFDGTIVYIPNAIVMASKISNFHQTKERRIEFNISINLDSDVEQAKTFFLKILANDERVLSTPAEPSIYISNVNSNGIQVTAYCWVLNSDWLSAKSDLWSQLLSGIKSGNSFSLAYPQQNISIINEKTP